MTSRFGSNVNSSFYFIRLSNALKSYRRAWRLFAKVDRLNATKNSAAVKRKTKENEKKTEKRKITTRLKKKNG
jgi:hypothetical protein